MSELESYQNILLLHFFFMLYSVVFIFGLILFDMNVTQALRQEVLDAGLT